MKDLAIVIPAFKATYLFATLESIASQTCQDFTLYVGDDCSPYDLAKIIKPFEDRIDLVYHRFNKNLGSKDLVSHWERCIAMTKSENWIWLFSDDDIMGARCVELFYKEMKHTHFDIYHYDVKEINEFGNETTKFSAYPNVTTSYYIYKNKMRGRLLSLVVENIFSKEVYLQNGGFVNFDLAWGSDTATWVIFSRKSGMKTIPGDNVYWRVSRENITPSNSQQIVERKLNALINFFRWSNTEFQDISSLKLKSVNLYGYLLRIRNLAQYTTSDFIEDNITKFLKMHQMMLLRPVVKLFLIVFKKKS